MMGRYGWIPTSQKNSRGHDPHPTVGLIACVVILVATVIGVAKQPASMQAQTAPDLVFQGCYDGDTCYWRQGNHRMSVRFARIDAPEVDGPCNLRAIESRSKLVNKIQSASEIVIDSIDTGKYGRMIAEVEADGKNLSNWMLQQGHATRWPDVESWRLCGRRPDSQ